MSVVRSDLGAVCICIWIWIASPILIEKSIAKFTLSYSQSLNEYSESTVSNFILKRMSRVGIQRDSGLKSNISAVDLMSRIKIFVVKIFF